MTIDVAPNASGNMASADPIVLNTSYSPNVINATESAKLPKANSSSSTSHQRLFFFLLSDNPPPFSITFRNNFV